MIKPLFPFERSITPEGRSYALPFGICYVAAYGYRVLQLPFGVRYLSMFDLHSIGTDTVSVGFWRWGLQICVSKRRWRVVVDEVPD